MHNKEELTSMVSVLAKLRKEGFTQDFTVTDSGQLCTIDGKECYSPEQLQIVNFYRFEGESNPDDMAILYVVQTATGTKGTISDAYGTYSDSAVESFMRRVEDLGKDLDRASRS